MFPLLLASRSNESTAPLLGLLVGFGGLASVVSISSGKGINMFYFLTRASHINRALGFSVCWTRHIALN